MIDTAAKRCSAIATRRLPWLRRFVPIPAGSVDQGDRQQVAYVYRGILAEPAAVIVTGPGTKEFVLPQRPTEFVLPQRQTEWVI